MRDLAATEQTGKRSWRGTRSMASRRWRTVAARTERSSGRSRSPAATSTRRRLNALQSTCSANPPLVSAFLKAFRCPCRRAARARADYSLGFCIETWRPSCHPSEVSTAAGQLDRMSGSCSGSTEALSCDISTSKATGSRLRRSSREVGAAADRSSTARSECPPRCLAIVPGLPAPEEGGTGTGPFLRGNGSTDTWMQAGITRNRC